MGLCEDYQTHFAAILSLGRGVGSYVPPPPAEPIPEGCNLSPCASPPPNIINAMAQYRNVMNDYFGRLAGACGASCTGGQEYRRSNFFGPWQPVIRNKCILINPPGGCAIGDSDFYLTDDLSCPLPPPPEPPEPPIYDVPISFLVEPTPSGGWSVTSETMTWPSTQYFANMATQNDCVCEWLRQLTGILFQVGNATYSIATTQAKMFPSAEFQQRQQVDRNLVLNQGFNMLARIIQMAVADSTGKEIRPIPSESLNIAGIADVEKVPVTTDSSVPAGTCNTYELPGPDCTGFPYGPQ